MKKLSLIALAILCLTGIEMYTMMPTMRQMASGTTINTVEEFDRELSRTKMSGKEILVVVFSTTWCKPCQKLKPIIQELIQERLGAKILLIDGDNKQLKKLVDQYAPEGFPTIRIFKNGKAVGEAGLDTKEKLRALIQKYVLEATLPSGYELKPTQLATPATPTTGAMSTKPTKPVYEYEEESSSSESSKGKLVKPQAGYGKGRNYYQSESESEGYGSEGESSSEGYSSSEEF